MPPELEPHLVEALRRELALGAPPSEGLDPPSPRQAQVSDSGPAGIRPAAKRMARRVLGPGVHRTVDILARRIMQRPELRELLEHHHAASTAQNNDLAGQVELLRGELRSTLGSAQHLREADAALGLARTPQAVEELRTATVNLELMKGELREVVRRLQDFALAIAPAAGLDGVGERFFELRERVNALDRRLRDLQAVTGGSAPPPSPGAELLPPPQDGHDRFDYVGFEARFRGSPQQVLEAQRERYFEVLRHHAPVVDIGCGRGELVEALAAEGIAAMGVDLNGEMVAEARARGLDVHHADAITWLREQSEQSLGAIITVHVVEHLELDPLIELLELAASRLAPGGVFVAETPNPASLIVLGNSYILDPTHVRPLHPSLLTFLCERAGFRQVTQRFFAPAEGYRLVRPPLGDDAPALAAALDAGFERLNDVLFGPQEYAVVATTAPLDGITAG